MGNLFSRGRRGLCKVELMYSNRAVLTRKSNITILGVIVKEYSVKSYAAFIFHLVCAKQEIEKNCLNSPKAYYLLLRRNFLIFHSRLKQSKNSLILEMTEVTPMPQGNTFYLLETLQVSEVCERLNVYRFQMTLFREFSIEAWCLFYIYSLAIFW